LFKGLFFRLDLCNVVLPPIELGCSIWGNVCHVYQLLMTGEGTDLRSLFEELRTVYKAHFRTKFMLAVGAILSMLFELDSYQSDLKNSFLSELSFASIFRPIFC
jgi:hypothetical protein